jgi:hypothetical protein
MKRPTHKIYRTTNWPHITEHSFIAEILPFGLILLRNGMLHQKANKGEIKPTPMQLSNAASFVAYDTKQCRQAITDWQAHAVIPARKNAKPWKDTKSSSLERNE